MYCTNCGSKLEEDALFCTKCGTHKDSTDKYLYCENCGSKITEDSAFCTGCGTPIPEEILETRKKLLKKQEERDKWKEEQEKAMANKMFLGIIVFFIIGCIIIAAIKS